VFAAVVVVVLTVTPVVDVVVLLEQEVNKKDGANTATMRKLKPNPTHIFLLFNPFSPFFDKL
jgi:hypothetical protein